MNGKLEDAKGAVVTSIPSDGSKSGKGTVGREEKRR